MYQHNGRQRYTEGNRGQHEMCPEQVKSLLTGTQHSFAHNPKVIGSNPVPATDVMLRDISDDPNPFQGSGCVFLWGP